VRALTDLGGPLFLTFASDPPSCLTIDDKSKVNMSTLLQPTSSQDSDDDDSDRKPTAGGPVNFDTAEPTAVHQVLVATMIPDSDRLTLKAFNGKYLSSDKFGIVTAHTEAIGMQEEWTAIIKADEEEGGIAFQNHYGKFLSVDEVAAETGKGTGIQIRADSDTIGFCEIFRAKIQARFRKKAKKAAGDVKIVTKDYEFDQRYPILFLVVR
jgi:protein FRG1